MAEKASPLAALKVRDFRLYWFALVGEIVGQHMFSFTLGWLAFEITGSQAQLGLIHLCAFVPQFLFTMLGGVLADRIDPRRLIQVAASILAAGILAVGILALQGRVEVWHLALAAFALGLSNAIDEPSRASFYPRLMPRSMLRSSVPLVSMAFGGSRIVAPSIAGFVIAAAGAPTSFLFAALAVSSMIAVLFFVRPASGPAVSHGSVLEGFTDSIRYIGRNEVFTKVILAALLNATFAMGYFHTLPVFAKDILGVDSRGLGILTSASGVGSLIGLVSYPWLQQRTTPRNVMVYTLTAFCFALFGFAFSSSFWLSCALLAIVGVAQAHFMTSFQVILQTLVEDSYRGRVMGMFLQVWSLIYLSGFLLNFTGSMMGPQLALFLGSAIMLAFVWMSLVRSTALARVSLAPRPV